jgi:type 1 glutamine amidotransferase
VTSVSFAADQIKVLIIDGINNHDWQNTTAANKATLEATGRFTVDVSTSPRKRAPEEEWQAWHPNFSNYDVVLSNFNDDWEQGGPTLWSEEMKADFEKFVREGGGFVPVHAADNSSADWKEYNEMIAIGGWGGRKAGKSGYLLRLIDGKWQATSPDKGRSGDDEAVRDYLVIHDQPDHPILKGLPTEWMHAEDELYASLRGPAKNVEVLAHSWCRLTNENEPMMMIVTYGKGKVFHIPMGHWNDEFEPYGAALHCGGFQTVLARGTEYVATGKVTIGIPDSFPTKEKTSVVAPDKVKWPAAQSTESGSHVELLTLFEEFNEFQDQRDSGDVSGDISAAMDEKYRELKKFQSRLAAIDSSSWSVSEQIDYHLVRAQMNGLEFELRVVKPWIRNPGYYGGRRGGLGRIPRLPLDEDRIAQFRSRLQAIPRYYEQAKRNLGGGDISEIASDLAILAIRNLERNRNPFPDLVAQLAEHHPDLVPDAKKAQAATEDYLSWLKENQSRMTASAGVGKENYNWLLKNVYLFPYTWDDVRTIVELEDNRVRTFQRLEENRNRNIPPLKPAATQEEYKQRVKEGIEHVMKFLREEEIFTVDDYLEWENYWSSGWHGWDRPWPERHDYFFNFSHREPVMEETHEMVGHSFDGQRSRRDTRPIRGGRLGYKISTSRGEGFAFALEELLMHAGYLDGRNRHAREIAYEQAAFRTVRALSDVYMHSGDWSLTDAMEFCVANAPHGELLDDSEHLWFELETTLVGVGHHMIMVAGKVQFMKLFRDRAQQLGDDFTLKKFMDEFLAAGMIPMSLIHWEMTGYDDEIKELW